MRVCIYAGSSQHCDSVYREAAFHLGKLLAEADCTLVYGGGSTGLMGAVANGALSSGGEVTAVYGRSAMGHPGLTRLELVEDMRERKHRLLTGADAVVALPGGCGTLEELFEAITLKQLGLYFNPIILLNTCGFYIPAQSFLKHVISERFMNPEHAAMWQLVNEPEDVLATIRTTPRWHENARDLAVVRP